MLWIINENIFSCNSVILICMWIVKYLKMTEIKKIVKLISRKKYLCIYLRISRFHIDVWTLEQTSIWTCRLAAEKLLKIIRIFTLRWMDWFVISVRYLIKSLRTSWSTWPIRTWKKDLKIIPNNFYFVKIKD